MKSAWVLGSPPSNVCWLNSRCRNRGAAGWFGCEVAALYKTISVRKHPEAAALSGAGQGSRVGRCSAGYRKSTVGVV